VRSAHDQHVRDQTRVLEQAAAPQHAGQRETVFVAAPSSVTFAANGRSAIDAALGQDLIAPIGPGGDDRGGAHRDAISSASTSPHASGA